MWEFIFEEKGLFEISENKNLSKITSYTVENDRKRKSVLPAKQQCKKSRQSSSDNSLSSRRSYSRYDGGPNAADVMQDVPPQHVQDLIISFYKTKVVTTIQQAKQLQLLTMQHHYDEMVSGI